MKIRRSAEEWDRIIAEYRESGNSMAQWCKEHGINGKTMSARITKLGLSKRRGKHGRSREEWFSLIEEQKSSELPLDRWCNERGISPNGMRSAIKRLEANPLQEKKQEWLQIPINMNAEEKNPIKSGIIRIMIGNVSLEADSDYPVEKLSSLISRLSEQ